METQSNKKPLIIGAVIAAVIVVAASAWAFMPRAPKFCFDFAHDMQFGDRKVAHPANAAAIGPDGIAYYLPEVPALQTALSRQGFYIDPYESTGGHVYAAAFFGPSTRVAVLGFQKKYGLPETGQVTNDMLDKLAALYSCPKAPATATSTAATATSTSTK